MELFDYRHLSGMLEFSARRILSEVKKLNELDTLIGDGDHGTTMLKVMTSLKNTMEVDTTGHCKQLLDDIGWDMMSQDGGSASMLIGCFYSGMATGFTEEETIPETLSKMFRSGASYLQKNSGARLGDKTMLDSLLPAVATFEESVMGGADLIEALRLATDAAWRGVDDTRDMLPIRGRAKNLGKRAIGVCDPGATSIALIFQGFYDYWKSGNK